MNLGDVMDELAERLDSITGLQVLAYSAQSISPPTAWVEWPEELNYDATMGRGSDSMTIEVWVAVGGLDNAGNRDLLSEYCNGSGTSSIKANLEGPGVAYDSAHVASVKFSQVQVAGTDYPAATFSVDITGSGA